MTIVLKARSTLKMDDPNKQTNMTLKHLVLSQSLGHTQDFLNDSLALSRAKFKSQPFEILGLKLNTFSKKNTGALRVNIPIISCLEKTVTDEYIVSLF